MNALQSALIALVVLVYMLYRQFVRRSVSQRDLLFPIAGGLYLAYVYLNNPGSATGVALVLGCALFGILTGLVSATVVQVWRDPSTGLVMQRGGWRYLAALLGLIVVRVLLRVGVTALRLNVGETALNDAFIGMAVANYAGRAIFVGLRALALLNWDMSALPRKRDATLGR